MAGTGAWQDRESPADWARIKGHDRLARLIAVSRVFWCRAGLPGLQASETSTLVLATLAAAARASAWPGPRSPGRDPGLALAPLPVELWHHVFAFLRSCDFLLVPLPAGHG